MLPDPGDDQDEYVDPVTLKPTLYTSAKEDDLSNVLKLLDDQVPPTYIDESGWTALHWAAKNGNAKMVRSLLDHRASAPYHYMVSSHTNKIKDPLREASIDSSSVAQSMDTLKETFESMQKRREEEELVDVSKSLLRNTPLQWAAFKGHVYIVWLLLCDGYSPNDYDDMGNNAVHLSAAAGHIKIVQILIHDGANCNVVNIYKNLPIDTTTDASIKELLVSAAQKSASMTLREATQKHEANIKWVKRLSDVISALELSHQDNADVDDEESFSHESKRLLKDLYEALQDAVEWRVSDELIAKAHGWVAQLETTHELQRMTDTVRAAMPIQSQRDFVSHTRNLLSAIDRAEGLRVDPRVVAAARSIIATCKCDLWLFMMRDRLAGIEIALSTHEHDVSKLGAAISKAEATGGDAAVVESARQLHMRLVAELEGSRALQSVPTVRLPMENPPEGYWLEVDKGRVVETPGFPSPPEGGEYIWEPSAAFSALQNSVETIRSLLGDIDGKGVNPILVTQLREKLLKIEKEFKQLEAKDTQDRLIAIEAAIKLAKKKKKGAKKH